LNSPFSKKGPGRPGDRGLRLLELAAREAAEITGDEDGTPQGPGRRRALGGRVGGALLAGRKAALAAEAGETVTPQTTDASAPTAGRRLSLGLSEQGAEESGPLPVTSTRDGTRRAGLRRARVRAEIEAEARIRTEARDQTADALQGSTSRHGAQDAGGEAEPTRIGRTVGEARMRPRHYGVLALFVLMVVLPTLSYSWYLWTRAADQYESTLGFGSRTEEAASTFAFLGALTGTSQSGSKDMDILYQFVVSQELVQKIDAELDLRAMWARPVGDPMNAFNPQGTIEDLVQFWQRMVRADYDNVTGLMTLTVRAFDPQDARRIGEAVLRESTDVVNQLSKTAQDDLTRYSKKMLDEMQQKLAEARLAVLDYQVRNNIVDPSNVVASQVTVVASLNQELANAQVERDLLDGTVPATDLRLVTLNRKIEVIENRIAVESAKVGAAPSQGSPGYATLVAEFGKLQVEQEFAQQAYLSAMAAHDQAMADAQKKTRYLATYLAPTLAEASTVPNRLAHAALTALIGFLAWAIVVLTYYALRDRR
jgi:capsular polysaccharide transport system permease protein